MRSLTFFTIISFLFPLLAGARLIDRTEAVVNKTVILYSDIQTFKEQAGLRRQTDPFLGFLGYNPSTNEEIRNFLVDEAIILSAFSASDEEVEQQIAQVRQQNNGISETQLKDMLRSQGINFNDYKNTIKVVLAKNKMIRQELQPLVNITEEEVKNYYYTGKEFYARKKSQSLVLSFDLVQVVLESKKAADDFYEIFRRTNDLEAALSEVDQGRLKVNQLGMLKETDLARNIRGALRGLKSGEFTKPIHLSDSFHQILFIKKLGAPKDSKFEEIKGRIQNMLFQKALKKQARLWLERRRNEVYIYTR